MDENINSIIPTAQHNSNKDRFFIRIAGFIALGWAILSFYILADRIFTLVNTNGLIPIELFKSGVIINIFTVISGFITAIGLIWIRTWARYYFINTICLIIFGQVKSILIIGLYKEELSCVFNFLFCTLFIWYFNRKDIKAYFPYHKNLKKPVFLWSLAVLLMISGWAYMWQKIEVYKYPHIQQLGFPRDSTVLKSSENFRPLLPLPYSVSFPENLTLVWISNDEELGLSFCITNKDSKYYSIHLNNLNIMQDDKIWKQHGFHDAYQFADKIFHERFGMLYILLRNIRGVNPRVSVFQTDDCINGFIQKCSASSNIEILVAYLYRNNHAIGSFEVLWSPSEDVLSTDQINTIISSIHFNDPSGITPRQHFEQGIVLFNQQSYNKAAFSFASAAVLDWENPAYHYHLAHCFYETDILQSAEKHLEKAISLNPDLTKARELLDMTQKKKSKQNKH